MLFLLLTLIANSQADNSTFSLHCEIDYKVPVEWTFSRDIQRGHGREFQSILKYRGEVTAGGERCTGRRNGSVLCGHLAKDGSAFNIYVSFEQGLSYTTLPTQYPMIIWEEGKKPITTGPKAPCKLSIQNE